ncbi:N-acetylglucosamine kinase [Paenibacillus pasadenensis]|uniref:N-acetylglucosamine kinase of eukaryotic type n=1 Tax=Paenibacillus pasadenensis TaxID=217090 RepID=A0A2N5N4V5_9BACL|nr:BadF/BadG/BcrA/BcrD ATPase family protein [Paenibacillus pasadenensis]PLT45377.1 N-acetylglucosamine kinase of eukaryotic type [Paenibacillus pasadenensis]
MSFYLGVDAGGTKTHALVSDADGRILGKGMAAGGNHQNGRDSARRNLDAAVSEALRQAGVERSALAHAYFGLAGADRQADLDILHPLLGSIGFAERYTVVCDTIIGLRAGTARPYGVSVICGTGVNCAGVSPSGDMYQCGGFSYMYGDFGGGGGLNVEVFRTVIRSWDGREGPTKLTPMLLEMLGYPTVEAMFHDYLDRSLGVPTDVVRLLFRAASEGDEAALRILTHQGEELALSVKAVIERLGMRKLPFDVVLAGSLLTRGDHGWISGPIAAMLRQTAPGASLVKLDVEPVVGALWGALEADRIDITPEMYRSMRQHREFDDIPIAPL